MVIPVVAHVDINRAKQFQLSATPAAAQQVMIASSLGIRRIKHIEKFLSVDAVVSPGSVTDAQDVQGVVVWGRKESAIPALKYAESKKLSVTYLEDGWVRSASTNAHSRHSYSLLVDELGVYYDPTCESQLEYLLNLSGLEFAKQCSAKQLQYAEDCRKQLVAADITKYNFCRTAILPTHDKTLVLVVDQTLDDASVRLGGMDANRFEEMLVSALEENPSAHIIVRTHPDVVAGQRAGYLTEIAKAHGVEISAAADNPMPWLKRADRVYVGTSQLGYEALLCGTKVSVFGKPFYAGWGLTDDRQALSSRSGQRSIDELFHVAHIAIARYVNPLDGERWQLHQCLDHVQLQQHWFAKNAQHIHCVGITPWKRRYVRQYLRSPDGSVSFNEAPHTAHSVYATWSFKQFRDGGPRTTEGDATPLLRIEDGFLRSAGLGSDFIAPGSLVVDSRGLYFDPSKPSDLEHLLNTKECELADIKRAASLRHRILKCR